MDRYTHVVLQEKADALQVLPELSPAEPPLRRPAGDGDRLIRLVAQLVVQLVVPAFTGTYALVTSMQRVKFP